MKILPTDRAFPAVVNGWTARGELIDTYHPTLAALRGQRVSGVYAIIDKRTGTVEYVGESHTGRLYDTITRHFRKWRQRTDRPYGQTGGVTFDRSRVKLAIVATTDADAPAVQYAEIQRLQPTQNQVGFGDAATEQAQELPPF